MFTSDIAVSPPDSLVKYDAPLFIGIEPSSKASPPKATMNESATKIEDMINSMLPPRYRKKYLT